jgi:hypothetical protein
LNRPGPNTSFTMSITNSGVTSQARLPRKIEWRLS